MRRGCVLNSRTAFCPSPTVCNPEEIRGEDRVSAFLPSSVQRLCTRCVSTPDRQQFGFSISPSFQRYAVIESAFLRLLLACCTGCRLELRFLVLRPSSFVGPPVAKICYGLDFPDTAEFVRSCVARCVDRFQVNSLRIDSFQILMVEVLILFSQVYIHSFASRDMLRQESLVISRG